MTPAGTDTPFDVLARSRFVLLTTFRRDGTPVPTAVWILPFGPELAVWTNPTAGKVKRIRRDPRVEIAPCTRRGKPLGKPIQGRARILACPELDRIPDALIRKYGLVARLLTLGNMLDRILHRPARPVGGLAIKVDEANPVDPIGDRRPGTGPE